jgi:hypothetical protein
MLIVYTEPHGIPRDQQQPDIMIWRNAKTGDESILERKSSGSHDGVGALRVTVPTTAGIDKNNERLLRQVADVQDKWDSSRGCAADLPHSSTSAATDSAGSRASEIYSIQVR